jgi:hypothetical protein
MIVIYSIFSALGAGIVYLFVENNAKNNSLEKTLTSLRGGTKKRSKKACNRKTKGKR